MSDVGAGVDKIKDNNCQLRQFGHNAKWTLKPKSIPIPERLSYLILSTTTHKYQIKNVAHQLKSNKPESRLQKKES